jgi:bisphosphoglycerate-dependent phosphoglycerate mutase
MVKVLGINPTNLLDGQQFNLLHKVKLLKNRNTVKGVAEAMEAGLILKKHNFKFDICFTSVQSRAIDTFNSLISVLG